MLTSNAASQKMFTKGPLIREDDSAMPVYLNLLVRGANHLDLMADSKIRAQRNGPWRDTHFFRDLLYMFEELVVVDCCTLKYIILCF